MKADDILDLKFFFYQAIPKFPISYFFCVIVMPQIAVVAVMCKPHRCPHIAMTGNICV